MNCNQKILKSVFTITLLLVLSVTYAQPGFYDDVNDEAAPISSLVVVGLIAGAAYGYKKLK